MGIKKIKLLVLAELNISNVHYMISEILQDQEDIETRFLTFRKPSFENDTRWFSGKETAAPFDLSKSLRGLSFPQKFIKLIHYIRDCDVVFTSGLGGFLVFLLRKPYIYFSYGSDLDQLVKHGCSIFQLNTPHTSNRLITAIKRYIKKLLYKLSIKNADVTIISQYQYPDIRSLGFQELGFFPHTLENDFLKITLEEKQKNNALIKKRYNCAKVLFSSSRHIWDEKYKEENDYKGNDVVIESLKSYVEKTADNDVKLFLIEKGRDIDKSKELIKKLGMEKNVVWLKQQPRRDLVLFYSGADIFFDQFSRGCLALCAIEAMACGTITITYIGERIKEVPFYSESPSLFNSKSIDDIVEFIIKVFSDNRFKRENEEASYNWVRRNCTADKGRDALAGMVKSLIRRKTSLPSSQSVNGSYPG